MNATITINEKTCKINLQLIIFEKSKEISPFSRSKLWVVVELVILNIIKKK